MFVKREVTEDVYVAVLQRLSDKVKAKTRLNPNIQWWNRTSFGSTSVHRCPW